MRYKSSVLVASSILMLMGESILLNTASVNGNEIPTVESTLVSNSELLEIDNQTVVERRFTLEPSISIATNPKTEATNLAVEVASIDSPVSNPILSPVRANSVLAQSQNLQLREIRNSNSDPTKIWAMADVSPISDVLSIDRQSTVKPPQTSIAQTPPSPAISKPTEPKKWAVGVHAQASTTGFIGVDAGYKFSPNLHTRLGLTTSGFGANYSSEGIDYNASFSPTNVHLLGDYFPFGGGLRLTSGLVFQNNRFTGSAKSNSSNQINVNNTNYNASEVGTIETSGRFSNGVAPYLGIGLGTPINSGFGFNLDLGVMFAGSPTVSLSANNVSPSVPTSIQNQFRSDLATQEQKTNADIKSFNLYPVVSIGFSYAF